MAKPWPNGDLGGVLNGAQAAPTKGDISWNQTRFEIGQQLQISLRPAILRMARLIPGGSWLYQKAMQRQIRLNANAMWDQTWFETGQELQIGLRQAILWSRLD